MKDKSSRMFCRTLRVLLLCVAALFCHFSTSGAPTESISWPFWDGEESIEAYARRAHLQPTKTIELGDGKILELVLIPAGEFVMGMQTPVPVDVIAYQTQIERAQLFLFLSGCVVLFLFSLVTFNAIRNRRRPQFSLRVLLAAAIATGGCILSALHWRVTEGNLLKEKTEYVAATKRFEAQMGMPCPAHKVTISKPFYLGKYEVTAEQFEQVTGKDTREYRKQYGANNVPITGITWDDAQAFCKLINEKAGDASRLPTESEWEYACRAGTKTLYYTGDTDADLYRAAWVGSPLLQPVGRKVPNSWGTNDMHGNVFEWCQDWEGEYPANAVIDPHGPSKGEYRVMRGGAYNLYTPRFYCQSTARAARDGSDYYIGFRIAVTITPK